MKMAICGKGGVGKSTICTILIHALLEKGKKVLAIDADPSPHLARLLGVADEHITPIAQMKDLLNERSQRNGPFYNLNPKVDDLPDKFMIKRGSLSLMVLGAIEQGGAGCACSDNAVLRNLLNRLLLTEDEDIVLDMEAGVEHLGRGTIASVDHILVVVQPYRGSMETAKKIIKLASDLKIKSVQLIANGCQDEQDMKFIENTCSMEPIGVFPFSSTIRSAERKGEPIVDSTSADLMNIAKNIIEKLEAMS